MHCCALLPRAIHRLLIAHVADSISPHQGGEKSECLTTRTGIEAQPLANIGMVLQSLSHHSSFPHLRSFLFCIRPSCRLSDSNQPESLFWVQLRHRWYESQQPFIPLRLWISISASISSRVYLSLSTNSRQEPCSFRLVGCTSKSPVPIVELLPPISKPAIFRHNHLLSYHLVYNIAKTLAVAQINAFIHKPARSLHSMTKNISAVFSNVLTGSISTT